jgi:hypothetical protein
MNFTAKRRLAVQPGQLKILLDRAAQMEPNIADHLQPGEYATLASVGSIVWPYDRAHMYAEKALSLGKATDDPLEQYAACLILGHIDFLRYRDTKAQNLLEEAREQFRAGSDLVDGDESPNNLHLVGQLYKVWGLHERYAGHKDDGEKVLDLAREAWGKLPQKRESDGAN